MCTVHCPIIKFKKERFCTDNFFLSPRSENFPTFDWTISAKSKPFFQNCFSIRFGLKFRETFRFNDLCESVPKNIYHSQNGKQPPIVLQKVNSPNPSLLCLQYTESSPLVIIDNTVLFYRPGVRPWVGHKSLTPTPMRAISTKKQLPQLDHFYYKSPDTDTVPPPPPPLPPSATLLSDLSSYICFVMFYSCLRTENGKKKKKKYLKLKRLKMEV